MSVTERFGRTRHALCAPDEIGEGQARGFSLKQAGWQIDVFIVRRGGNLYAYRNRCPHTGVNLEWLPDAFLDYEGSFIQCSLHGALFTIEEGRCVRGPCVGDRLEFLPILVQEGKLCLELEEGGPKPGVQSNSRSSSGL
jgi:nitrite reductase/ring-hydroxylating ferredoxin subunit